MCGTCVVVDVVYMSVRISHLKPRWEIFLSHDGVVRGEIMRDWAEEGRVKCVVRVLWSSRTAAHPN